MNFTDIIKTALPWIGAAATGNVAGLVTLAANAVSGALGQEVKADAQSIAAAVSGATPEQMIALKQADNDFAIKMRQLGIQEATDLAKIEVDNVNSARSRDDGITKAGRHNYRADSMYVLAIVVICWLVYIVWVDADISEYVKGIFTLVLGRFLGYLDNIYNFEFGTTRSSQAKDTTINNLSKA